MKNVAVAMLIMVTTDRKMVTEEPTGTLLEPVGDMTHGITAVAVSFDYHAL